MGIDEVDELSEPQAGATAFGGDEGVDLKGRYQLYPERPLPQYDSPTAAAYAAKPKSGPARDLIALICDPEVPPRFDMLESLKAFNLPGMLKTADSGVVQWGAADRRFAILLERPGGPRVMPQLRQPQAALGEDLIVTGLLQSLLSSLKELAGRGIAHRAIRPDNMFYSDASRRMIALGEGVSSPPALSQPAIFETIETAMCDPAGRGVGSQANDLYSLGITILFLIGGKHPVPEMSDDELLAAKIEYGTFAALGRHQRIPLQLMEPLRGLLIDDAKERWTVTDLDMWLSGRRQSPKQTKLAQRASRPYTFKGKEYYNARNLAMAMTADVGEAMGALRSRLLDSWMRNSLADEERADAVQAAIGGAAAQSTAGEERLVARACIALDPAAPIRYKGFGVMIDGIGYALAMAMNDNERRQLVSEVIASRLPVHWVAAQVKPRAEDVRAVQLLEKLPGILDQQAIGFGVERALYELNPFERCHSPMIEAHYVLDLIGLVPALEEVARRSDRGANPVDRHIVAFIAARARKWAEELMRHMVNTDPAIRLLAVLQEQSGSGPAPALCQWIASLITPVGTHFHNRERRQRIVDRMKAASESGVLGELLAVADNNSERATDAKGFAEAVAEYRSIDEAVRNFDRDSRSANAEARLFGEQIAASIAGVLVTGSAAIALFLAAL
jgi:hypothetical protein